MWSLESDLADVPKSERTRIKRAYTHWLVTQPRFFRSPEEERTAWDKYKASGMIWYYHPQRGRLEAEGNEYAIRRRAEMDEAEPEGPALMQGRTT